MLACRPGELEAFDGGTGLEPSSHDGSKERDADGGVRRGNIHEEEVQSV
jgi:hypothetical protein